MPLSYNPRSEHQSNHKNLHCNRTMQRKIFVLPTRAAAGIKLRLSGHRPRWLAVGKKPPTRPPRDDDVLVSQVIQGFLDKDNDFDT
ncbi:hypothetical protein PISMIDRAFT_677549 [Pisolithus microcarpus 441]|uniref:Uncharacterized protein n=1 Tax=Pisolithus microcarpus 441 TaxID=765257 RepID=A0A0C9Z737_9AGAM|nr:hypothetical protein PISMIDRAFT_677549 [Pisolithus microcarpus 441]